MSFSDYIKGYIVNNERNGSSIAQERMQKFLFDGVRDWITFAVDSKRINTVYLDTTTLYTVDKVLQGQNNFLLPTTLHDLSTFVNAVVLYDNVIHLENRSIDSLTLKFNEALGNQAVFISLPVDYFHSQYSQADMSLTAVLERQWYKTRQCMSDMRDAAPGTLWSGDREDIRKAWEIILGRSVEDADLFKKDEEIALEFYSPTNLLLKQLLDVSYGSSTRDFICKCNQRSLFNLEVSNLLKLHYMPGYPRMPFRQFLYKRAKDVQSSLSWIKCVDEEYKNLYEMYFAPDESNLLLPFLLAAVLSKIKSGSLSDFFEALVEVRRDAETFRKHRAELDGALIDKDADVVKRIRKALEQDADQLRIRFPWVPVCGGIAAVLAAINSAFPILILSAIGLLTTASQSSDYVHKLRERMMYPEYWFLANLNQTAQGMMDALPTIKKLWHLDESRAEGFASQFDRLKALQYG